MKEIEALCKALKEKNLKSKQATFNYYYDDFCAAKDLYGWDSVAKFINSETGGSIAVSAYKSMFKRAKKKAFQKQSTPDQPIKIIERPAAKPKEQKAVSQAKEDVNNPVNGDILKEYLKFCFNNEKLATYAIEHGISIEMIKSWKCPNLIRLSTFMSNYSQTK